MQLRQTKLKTMEIIIFFIIMSAILIAVAGVCDYLTKEKNG